jgi:hypothetical protein
MLLQCLHLLPRCPRLRSIATCSPSCCSSTASSTSRWVLYACSWRGDWPELCSRHPTGLATWAVAGFLLADRAETIAVKRSKGSPQLCSTASDSHRCQAVERRLKQLPRSKPASPLAHRRRRPLPPPR